MPSARQKWGEFSGSPPNWNQQICADQPRPSIQRPLHDQVGVAGRQGQAKNKILSLVMDR